MVKLTTTHSITSTVNKYRTDINSRNRTGLVLSVCQIHTPCTSLRILYIHIYTPTRVANLSRTNVTDNNQKHFAVETSLFYRHVFSHVSQIRNKPPKKLIKQPGIHRVCARICLFLPELPSKKFYWEL